MFHDGSVIIPVLIIILDAFRANANWDDYHAMFNALHNNGQTRLRDAFDLTLLFNKMIRLGIFFGVSFLPRFGIIFAVTRTLSLFIA